MEKTEIQIGKALPRGAKKKIAEKLGVSQATIVNYFKGKQKLSADLELKVLAECEPYVVAKKEFDKAKSKLLDLLK